MFYVFDYVFLRLRISHCMRVSQRKADPGTMQVLLEGPMAVRHGEGDRKATPTKARQEGTVLSC